MEILRTEFFMKQAEEDKRRRLERRVAKRRMVNEREDTDVRYESVGDSHSDRAYCGYDG